MNCKRKSRRRFFLLMRSGTPPISSEFRGEGGLNTTNPQTPLAVSVYIYQTALCHVPEDSSFSSVQCGNLKYCSVTSLFLAILVKRTPNCKTPTTVYWQSWICPVSDRHDHLHRVAAVVPARQGLLSDCQKAENVRGLLQVLYTVTPSLLQ